MCFLDIMQTSKKYDSKLQNIYDHKKCVKICIIQTIRQCWIIQKIADTDNYIE